MISKKELEYLTLRASKVPYPGRDYCEQAMDKLCEGLKLYDTKYANRKYNITFSNLEEIELEIKQKNINHMLGIEHKNLTSDYFKKFRKEVLDYNPELSINSYDLLKLIVENKEKVMDFDENNKKNDIPIRAINYYKISIKCDIFSKLADLSKFNYGCINFDKNKFIELNPIEIFSSNSTKFLYAESDESVSPYYLMGLKKESDNSNISEDVDCDDYSEKDDNKYIVETLIAPEHINYFFNGQEVVIPTQILTDLNGLLDKSNATPTEKIKLLKDYRSIVSEFNLPNMINIYGDYLSHLMECEREKTLLKTK